MSCPPTNLTMQQLTVFTAVLLVVITASLQHVPRPAQPLSFDYPSFPSNPPNITFQGDASAGGSGGVIDLTPIWPGTRSEYLIGRAVYRNPFPLWEYTTTGDGDRLLADFTTRFSFAVRPAPGYENYTGDGLAFFLAPYGSDIPRNGSRIAFGGSLGLFLVDQVNPLPTVAVEFDTFRNQWDPGAVHVGIDVQTIESVVSARWPEIDPRVGATVDATISYDAGATTLSVFFQGNGTHRNLSHVVDLSKVLPDRVNVGFSAATGSNVEFHQILSWSFNSSMVVLVPGNRTSTSTGPNDTKNKKLIIVGVLVGVLAGVGALATGVLAVLAWRRRRSRSGRGRRRGAREAEGGVLLDMVIDGAGRGPRRFAYSELVRATNNFAAEAMLGRGGFGAVYRGVLMIMSDNNNIPPIRSSSSSSPTMEVAVKRVAKDSRQGKKEYVSEVRIISRLRHRNLVQLVGWCHEIQGELLLVYEYMPNGSLDAHLYGAATAPLLPWPTRYDIAQGVAAALLYLHDGWEQCVVHRDVKPSNVMLDGNFNAKLGDFGLARLVDHGRGLQTTVLAGTMGYLAPECTTTGKASKESDVYSFGVVALEIACGRSPIEPTAEEGRVVLVNWVWHLHSRRAVLEAADPRLIISEESLVDEMQMERLMVVGLWCAHPDFRRRPSMRQVVAALNFETPPPDLPTEMPELTYGAPTGTDLAGNTWLPSSTKSPCSSTFMVTGGASTVSTSSGGSAASAAS